MYKKNLINEGKIPTDVRSTRQVYIVRDFTVIRERFYKIVFMNFIVRSNHVTIIDQRIYKNN